MIMNKRTPVPGYKLLPSPSTKLKLKDNHYETPCIIVSVSMHTFDLGVPLYSSYSIGHLILFNSVLYGPVLTIQDYTGPYRTEGDFCDEVFSRCHFFVCSE